MCNLTVILSVFPLYTGCLDPPYTPSKNCNKIGIFIRILGKNLIFLNIKTTIWQCTSQGGPLHGPAVLYCNDYILCQVTWSHDIQQCTSCGSPHRGPTVFCCSASKLFQKKSNMEAPLQQNSIGTFEGGGGVISNLYNRTEPVSGIFPISMLLGIPPPQICAIELHIYSNIVCMIPPTIEPREMIY